ncbi:MAG: hypothetical protein AAGN46_04390 [Acidobacteriota bacterium]
MARATLNVRILDGDYLRFREGTFKNDVWKHGLDQGLRSLRVLADPEDKNIATIETEWRDLDAYRKFAAEKSLDLGDAEIVGKPQVRVDHRG